MVTHQILQSDSLRLGLLIAVVVVGLTGCGAVLVEPPQPAAVPPTFTAQPTVVLPTAQATVTGAPTGQPTQEVPMEDSSLAAQARSDLAARLKLRPEEIEVVSVERTEMPVGSLGCDPSTKVQLPGLIIGDEITLRAQGQEYVYRSDGVRLVPCSPADLPGGRQQSDSLRPSLAPGGRPAEFRAQELAIADLAGRLGIAKSAVKVLQIEAVEWPDASLGCPQPGMMYAQVITPGYRILLEAVGQTYDYRATAGRVMLCEK
jgi:ribosomal protein L20A (L18A)